MATFIEKVKFLRGLLSGETAQAGPFFAALDVTRRCNLRCVGCRYHSPDFRRPSSGDQSVLDMPFPLFRKLLADLKGMGTSSLYFIGEEESLLHDNILDFIALAKQSGLRVTLLSNALLLDETMAQGLIEARLDIPPGQLLGQHS